MASTSASTAAQPTQLLPALRVSRGDLSIKTADSEAWVRLDSPEGDKNHNCYGVWFDAGITVLQVNRKTGGTCKVKFIVESPPTIILDKSSGQPRWSVEAKCLEIGEPEMDSTKADNKAAGYVHFGIKYFLYICASLCPLFMSYFHSESIYLVPRICTLFSNADSEINVRIENAKKFALASLDKATDMIKLGGLLTSNFSRKGLTDEEVRGQITRLSAVKARGSAETDAGVYLHELFEVSMAERDYQVQKTMKQTGCNVQILANAKGSQLKMLVWPRVHPDANDVEVTTDDLPLRFEVHDHPLLTAAELDAHPIMGQGKAEAWEMNVIKSAEAPIVGVIANSFKNPADMRNFIGTASNVTLDPIIDDILGTRARKAVRELESTSADQEGLDIGEISEYLDPAKELSHLPLDSLFLVGKPVPPSSALELTLKPAPPKWDSGLKPSQRDGVLMAMKHKLSAVHGPPGTGKSQVASRILWTLLNMPDGGKVLCSTPANVALESLFSRCIKECEDRGMKKLPFVRVWSVSQTKAQYANGDHAVLNGPYHIEKLRVERAQRDPQKYARYLQGHQRLLDFGVINDKALYGDWDKATTSLTREVMNEAKVAFCTTAALSSPALRWKEDGVPMTWEASTWLLDEAGQANPDAILLGLVTFAKTLIRFTMLGDHLQLGGFKGSKEAKKLYKTSFLQKFVDRGFPYRLLNHQFRALDTCMWPVNTGKN